MDKIVDNTIQPKKHKSFVYIVGIAAALAGLLFGVDVGVVNGAINFIQTDFGLPDHSFMLEAIVSGVLYGAIFGALISGPLSRHFGRRWVIIVSAIIFCVGALLCAFAPSAKLLLVFRIFLGIAVGMASFTAPLYLSEVAPKDVRGGLVALYQFMITIGILVAYISDACLTSGGNWRLMLGITFVPAFIMFVIVLILPKSPRWLILKGNYEQAIQVLNKMRHKEDVESEASEIQKSLKHKVRLKEIFNNPFFLRVLLLGCALQLIQQFSGINVIIYYSGQIFKMSGVSSALLQNWMTVIVGTVNMLTTIIAIFYVDKWGRRPILIAGSIIMILSMFAMASLMGMGVHSHAMLLLTLAAVLCFIIGFAVSFGPIMWIMCSEIFPIKGREFGITVTTMTNWVCNAIVGSTFLSLIGSLGSSGTFLLYGAVGIVFLVFIIAKVPETKDISLEKIEENLVAGKSVRHIGQ